VDACGILISECISFRAWDRLSSLWRICCSRRNCFYCWDSVLFEAKAEVEERVDRRSSSMIEFKRREE